MSGARAFALALLIAAAAGCAADRPAPVDDYSIAAAPTATREPPSSYEVRRGDTLYSIAFRFGLDYRTLARWNGIAAPYTIYPGQRLRFEAGREARTAAAGTASQPRGVVSEPLPVRDGAAQPGRPAAESTREPAPAAAATPPSPPATQPPAPAATEQVDEAPPSRWMWPAEGPLLSSFSAGDSARNGIKIGGDAGRDVVASAAGVVVYSGSGLIGYGELIIVKHGSRYLTAYGHNRKRLVSEGEKVSAGQRIAKMGSTGAPRPMLHFEIRRDGKPVDPLSFLPRR